MIDLTGWDLEKDGPIKLNGEWEFYWKTFITPEQCLTGVFPQKKNYLNVPSLWISYITQSYPELDGLRRGYGTFLIKVKGLSPREDIDLALMLKAMQSSYALYFVPERAEAVQSFKVSPPKPLMKNGVVATNEKDAISQYLSQLKRIPAYTGSDYIILHISNYYFYTVAFSKELILGTEDDLRKISNKNGLLSFLIIGIIIIMAVYHLSLFFFNRKQQEYLFFGLICSFISFWYLLWDGYISELFPEPSYATHFFIENLTTLAYSIVLPLFVSFFRRLFKDEVSIAAEIISWSITTAYFILRVIKLPVDHYLFFYYNIVVMVAAVAGFFILIAAVLRRRPGSLLMLIGFIVFGITVFHDILQANLIVFSNTLTAPYGLAFYILTQSFIFTKTYANLAVKAEVAKAEMMVSRYDKSYLTGVDIPEMKNRLGELMEKEKLFRDEKLSIKSLADAMPLTIHQMSELLNNVLNFNFFNYINAYRIQEAKRILREDINRSILSIAFDVGFNSATSFYRTFKKLTGRTPQEYRNDSQKDSADKPA